MSEELDQVLRAMQELTTTVREHTADRATIDMKAIAEAAVALLDGREQAQPQRWGAAEETGTPVAAPGPLSAEMRIASAGPHRGLTIGARVSTGRYRGLPSTDLWLASELLRIQGRQPSDELDLALKALSTTELANWIPTLLASEIWSDIYLASRVAGLFPRVAMPSNPFDEPADYGDIIFRKGNQNTATTATSNTVENMTLTAGELVGEVDFSYTADEDSIIAVLPNVRRSLVRCGAEYIDKALLNADATNAATGNINLDDADPDDDLYYLYGGGDGLRHLFLVDNTAQGVDVAAAPSVTGYQSVLAKLGRYAVDINRLAWIVDVWTWLANLAMDEFLTVDKMGPNATLLTGQVGSLFGIPVIVSGGLVKTEADGKVSTTGANNTKGQAIVVHRDMWHVGFRRELLIEADRDIQKRQNILVASFRMAVQAYGTKSAATHTAGGYDITV